MADGVLSGQMRVKKCIKSLTGCDDEEQIFWSDIAGPDAGIIIRLRKQGR